MNPPAGCVPKGVGSEGWSALRSAAGRYGRAASRWPLGWNCCDVGANSYDELVEFVLVGDEPADMVRETILCGDSGDEADSTTAATATGGSVVVVVAVCCGGDVGFVVVGPPAAS